MHSLAGHSMQHELEVAIAANALGSIDATPATFSSGWDYRPFPTDIT
jgi:xylose isomerase